MTFLDSIAGAYAEKFDDLSDFCFVFPNKRAGRFFQEALSRQISSDAILGPEVISIPDFVEALSGLETASRIEMLFRLFNIYKEKKGELRLKSKDNDLLEFDSFRNWGEILLSDFSEVDQYNIDADELFANVSDYREISSNFLTDDQLEVLEKYFGYSPSTGDVKRFWKNFSKGGEGLSDIKRNFLYLWQAMGPLYHGLNETLEAEGLATPGRIYRRALERVEEEGRGIVPYRKIVFVGFNALSTTEALLFETLVKAGGVPECEEDSFVDFFWDATGPVLESQNSDSSFFLRLNKRNFPSPDWAQPWLEKNRVTTMPSDFRVIASPSNSAQAKIASRRLEEVISAEKDGEKIEEAKVAVVLPDENLLLPLLYAMPEKVESVNLTMGYSLRFTSIASFMHHLRVFHARSRYEKGTLTFFHEDVKALLSHPFTHLLVGTKKVADFNTYITTNHKFRVAIEDFNAGHWSLDKFPLDVASFGEGATGGVLYNDHLLASIDESLAEGDSGVTKSRVDRSNIATYRNALWQLKNTIEEHDIDMGLSSVFYMVDKLLAGEHVTFEGEPLEGVQVMGLLETRALDFEHLIILSLNDKVMPRKARKATFIPDSLRYGYGMPYSNYQERLFSYYFYRMISRAKSVTLIYDARSGEGMRSGGESRYLTQLRYLYARNKIKYENYQFSISGHENQPEPILKTPEMMAKIQEYAREGSRKNLSASALKKYGECQIKFYYEQVEGIRTDQEEAEFIDAITQGNIVHETMLMLYFPEGLRGKYLKGRIAVSGEDIDRLMGDTDRIRDYLRRNINRLHYHLPKEEQDRPLEGASEMIASQLEHVVLDILSYDRKLTPFELAGGEMADLWRWEYEPGKFVNMKFAIDRLDVLNPGRAESERWRIVDYKTGKPSVTAAEFEDIFNGSHEAKNIFQLMLYANLMNLYTGQNQNVITSIYSAGEIRKGSENRPKVEGKELTGHQDINEQFIERLNANIRELFNPDAPFRPAEKDDNCRYCKLHDLCGRS
ncbi:MAG: PD-(D/E)XK nuclease family protein [Muribaculaceae bacterium]|nr:PD-(D/E)XK nuclease family protein [Muribaculaceae bacterium]